MRFVIYNQSSRGRPSGKHKAAINSWTATWLHQQRRSVKNDCLAKGKQQEECILCHLENSLRKRKDKGGSALSCSHTPSSKARGCAGRSHPQPPRRINAHGSFPCELRPDEHMLIHYHVNVMSQHFSGLPQDSRHPARFDDFRDANFQIGLQHPLAFRIIVLGTAAGHGLITKGEVFRQQFEYQQYRSLREMQAYFDENKNDCSDLAISICLFRAMTETSLGPQGNPLIHMQAALRMIQARGGYQALINNHHLMALLPYFCLRFIRLPIHLPNTMHIASTECMEEAIEHPLGHASSTSACTYIIFLADAAKLSHNQSEQDSSILPLRHTVFVQNPYIVRMLQPSKSSTQPFAWQEGYWLAVLTALTLLNRALLDYKDDTTLTNTFLKDFKDRMEMMEADGHQSAKSITKMLMYPSSYNELNLLHWDRVWFSVHMVRWIVKLNGEYEGRTMQRLYANLTFDQCLTHSPKDICTLTRK